MSLCADCQKLAEVKNFSGKVETGKVWFKPALKGCCDRCGG